MRPQTTVALVLGALLGIGITWFALVRETTNVVTEASPPPARVRPGDTRLKQSISGAQSSRAQDEVNDVAENRPVSNHPIISVRSGSRLDAEQEAELFDTTAATAVDAPSISSASSRSTIGEDQIIEPGEDGSYSSYRRIESLIVRTDYSSDNVRLQSITYQIDSTGLLLSYEVLDENREKLYRASLGFSKQEGPTFGKIVKELLYGVGQNQLFETEENGVRKERHAYMFVHSYTEDGAALVPVGISLTEQINPNIFRSHSGEIVSFGTIPAHIITALNNSYPIAPPIKL